MTYEKKRPQARNVSDELGRPRSSSRTYLFALEPPAIENGSVLGLHYNEQRQHQRGSKQQQQRQQQHQNHHHHHHHQPQQHRNLNLNLTNHPDRSAINSERPCIL